MDLAQQPLFRLLGALIVLLVTDYRPLWGLGAGLLWIVWVYTGLRIPPSERPPASAPLF